MICKIIWGWVQSGFISLPVVWLAGFPTNCRFMRAFKEHVFNSGTKKHQQIGKTKAGFLVMFSPLSSPWVRWGEGETFSKEENGSGAETQRQSFAPPTPMLTSGNSLELCFWLQLTSYALQSSPIFSKHLKPEPAIPALLRPLSPALFQAAGWGKMS